MGRRGQISRWPWVLGLGGVGITFASLAVPGDCGSTSMLSDPGDDYPYFGDDSKAEVEPTYPWGSRPYKEADLELNPAEMPDCEIVLPYSCPKKYNEDGVPIAYGYDKYQCNDASHWNQDVDAVGVAFPHVALELNEKVLWTATSRIVKYGKLTFKAAKAVPVLSEIITITQLSHDVISETTKADGLCTCSRSHYARRQVMDPIPDVSCSEPSYCAFKSSDKCEVFEYHATQDCDVTWVDYVNPSDNKQAKIKDSLEKTQLTAMRVSHVGPLMRCGGDGLGSPTARACCPSGSYAVKAEAGTSDQIICVSEEYSDDDQTLLAQACEQFCRLDVDGPNHYPCGGLNDAECAVRRDQVAADDINLRDTEAGSEVNCNARILAAGGKVTASDEERMSGPPDYESVFNYGANCEPDYPIAATTCQVGVRCENQNSTAYKENPQDVVPADIGIPFLKDYESTHGKLDVGGPAASDLKFVATGLPPGISLDADTGIATGVPVYNPVYGENEDDSISEHQIRIDVVSTNGTYSYRESGRFIWYIDHQPGYSCDENIDPCEGYIDLYHSRWKAGTGDESVFAWTVGTFADKSRVKVGDTVNITTSFRWIAGTRLASEPALDPEPVKISSSTQGMFSADSSTENFTFAGLNSTRNFTTTHTVECREPADYRASWSRPGDRVPQYSALAYVGSGFHRFYPEEDYENREFGVDSLKVKAYSEKAFRPYGGSMKLEVDGKIYRIPWAGAGYSAIYREPKYDDTQDTIVKHYGYVDFRSDADSSCGSDGLGRMKSYTIRIGTAGIPPDGEVLTRYGGRSGYTFSIVDHVISPDDAIRQESTSSGVLDKRGVFGQSRITEAAPLIISESPSVKLFP